MFTCSRNTEGQKNEEKQQRHKEEADKNVGNNN